MKKQIDSLIKLQKIETETGRIKSKLNDVTTRFEILDSKLKAFEQTMKDEEFRLSELKKQYRDYESDTQTNISRIEKSQGKLRAVKTNREYTSVLKEIEELKAINSRIEDAMLECLDQTESIEKAIAARKNEYSKLSEQVENEKEIILQETKEGEKKLSQLEIDRQKCSCMVDSELLERFNKVKNHQIGNIGIAPVKDAVCQGCNMNLPPQMYNELYLSNSLKFCPNCQRIIYLEKT